MANFRGPYYLIMTLAVVLNYRLAKNTWMSHRIAANHVERISKDLRINLTFSFFLEDFLTYIG